MKNENRLVLVRIIHRVLTDRLAADTEKLPKVDYSRNPMVLMYNGLFFNKSSEVFATVFHELRN